MGLYDFGIGVAQGVQQQFGSEENIRDMQRSFERGVGSYDVEKDPQYWQEVVRAEELQTPEAQRAVWEQYQDYLPYDDFDTFAENTFKGAEGTSRAVDERLSELELSMAEEEEEFATGLGSDVREKEAEEKLEFWIPHQTKVAEEEYGQLQTQGDMRDYEFDEHKDRRDYRDFMAEIEMEQALMQNEQDEMSLEEQKAWHEHLDDRIANEMEQMELSLEGAKTDQELRDLQLEISEATAPEEIEQAKIATEEMRHQLDTSKSMAPIEKETAEKRLELLEAQIAAQEAQTADTWSSSFGLGEGEEGEGSAAVEPYEGSDIANAMIAAVNNPDILESIQGESDEILQDNLPSAAQELYDQGIKNLEDMPTTLVTNEEGEEVEVLADPHQNNRPITNWDGSMIPAEGLKESQRQEEQSGLTYSELISNSRGSAGQRISELFDTTSGGFGAGQPGQFVQIEEPDVSTPTQTFIEDVGHFEGYESTPEDAINYLMDIEKNAYANNITGRDSQGNNVYDMEGVHRQLNESMDYIQNNYLGGRGEGISIRQLITELETLKQYNRLNE